MKRLVICALLAATQARAQDQPATTPTRDVDVLYVSTAGGHSLQQRSRFDVTAQKLRIDAPSPGLHLIVDRAARSMDMVSDGDRGVLQLPYDPSRSASGVAVGQAFKREGSDTVAGLPCTDWDTTEKTGRPVTLCFTGDGVLLRVRSGATVVVQAIKVVYGPIDPSIFDIPADYQRRSPREPSK